MKVILPWVEEMATVPKEIEFLLEKRALEDWYSEHSKLKHQKMTDKAYQYLRCEKQRVRKFMLELSDVERVVLYLRYWESLLELDISMVMGMKEKKVREILSDAVKKLRSLYIMELNRLQRELRVCA